MAHLFLVLLARQRQYEQENQALQMHSCLYTGVSMLMFVRGKKKFLEKTLYTGDCYMEFWMCTWCYRTLHYENWFFINL